MKKRYVIAIPGNVQTGGPEALHQLCAMMRSEGMDAATLYYGPRHQEIIAAYQRVYATPEFSGPVDAAAILILPEAENPASWRAKGWQNLCVWWLSATRVFPLTDYAGVFHCFQSFHARQQCGTFGLRGAMLTDYLGESALEAPREPAPKGDVVLVNHRSAHLIRPLAKALPECEVNLLAGLGRREVAAEMRRGKVYLDFGWHPGRDRMPREAALAGCVVITGTYGASFGEDVPIPAEFKLADPTPEDLARVVRDALGNYAEKHRQLANYRRWIEGQKEEFRREVAALEEMFTVGPTPLPPGNPGLDREWIAIQKELQSLRFALSRTSMFEAICFQAVRGKKAAWRYLFRKASARWKKTRAR